MAVGIASSGRQIPAVVTAGGRLSGPLAEAAGTTIKALAPVGGAPLIEPMLRALAATPGVGQAVIVGPTRELAVLNGVAATVARIEEGATGTENMRRGLEAVEAEAGEGHVLLCTSDMPFIEAGAIAWLLDNAPRDADIVYPVIRRADYDAAFPGSPNTWARLAGTEYTGGSILLVRPAAIRRNLALIEQVFHARKSQIGMAGLLGVPFVIRFLTGTLTVPQAEARACALTGCSCRALVGAPPQLAVDIDTLADYQWATARCTAASAAILGARP